jgi:hypothetical protein
MVDDEETPWNVSKQTILEAAPKQGIDAPYPVKADAAAVFVESREQLKWRKFHPNW